MGMFKKKKRDICNIYIYISYMYVRTGFISMDEYQKLDESQI